LCLFACLLFFLKKKPSVTPICSQR
jgi:hypothetical protein